MKRRSFLSLIPAAFSLAFLGPLSKTFARRPRLYESKIVLFQEVRVYGVSGSTYFYKMCFRREKQAIEACKYLQKKWAEAGKGKPHNRPFEEVITESWISEDCDPSKGWSYNVEGWITKHGGVYQIGLSPKTWEQFAFETFVESEEFMPRQMPTNVLVREGPALHDLSMVKSPTNSASIESFMERSNETS